MVISDMLSLADENTLIVGGVRIVNYVVNQNKIKLIHISNVRPAVWKSRLSVINLLSPGPS